ncbi:reverse transcriptase domain-containing protein [Tanacetum coccineum]
MLKGCLNKKDFTWTREADKAFEEMKRYIEKLPTLAALKSGENLIVYLAASKECISTVLMAERGKDQRPIYFMSRVLRGAELNYPTMEKHDLALIHVARNGASSGDGFGAGLMVVSPEGTEFTYALKFEFTATNNEAEYEAVIAGLRIAKEMKIEEITFFVVS